MKSSMITAPPGHKGRIRAVRAEWPKYGDKLALCVVFCAARSPLGCFEVALTEAIRTPRVVGALILIKVHRVAIRVLLYATTTEKAESKDGRAPTWYVLPTLHVAVAK